MKVRTVNKDYAEKYFGGNPLAAYLNDSFIEEELNTMEIKNMMYDNYVFTARGRWLMTPQEVDDELTAQAVRNIKRRNKVVGIVMAALLVLIGSICPSQAATKPKYNIRQEKAVVTKLKIVRAWDTDMYTQDCYGRKDKVQRVTARTSDGNLWIFFGDIHFKFHKGEKIKLNIYNHGTKTIYDDEVVGCNRNHMIVQ